jgi:hypothetical protein
VNKRILRHPIFFEANDELLERFWEYHIENPWVYGAFKRLAHKMARVRDRYGAPSIIQKIRWDHDVTTRGDSFKINNDYGALYARMLIAEDSSFEDFFELRRMKKYDRRCSGEERYRKGAP